MFDQELGSLKPRGPYYSCCFLGHVFEWRRAKRLKKVVQDFLGEWGMEIYDTDKPGGLLWENIIEAIRNTPFGLYDVSADNAENVYAELGYALAIDKPAYILVSKKAIRKKGKKHKEKPKSDFSGYVQIRYENSEDLFKQLKEKVPQDLTSPSWRLRIRLQSSTEAQKRALCIILKNDNIRAGDILAEMLFRGISWNMNDVANLVYVFKEFLELTEGTDKKVGDTSQVSIYPKYKDAFNKVLLNQLKEDKQYIMKKIQTCDAIYD